MNHWLARTELLIGKQAVAQLQQAKVAVIGIGGVGGAAAEALVRAGVGNLLLIDHDTVDVTNINRQLFTTANNIGCSKCEAGKARLLSINPNCNISVSEAFYAADNREPLLNFDPDFVIDAIDTVSAKLDLVVTCNERNIPLISCLGTGNRLDPTQFVIGDISDTAKCGCGCGLARVMRRELRKRKIYTHPVVYSTEIPKTIVCPDSTNGRHSPASISFCPPVAGYLLASYAVKQLISKTESNE